LVNKWPSYTPTIAAFSTNRTHVHTVEVDTTSTLLPVLLVVVGYISAFRHFIVFGLYNEDVFDAIIQSRKNYLRWIDYGITSPMMIVVIGILCGVVDVWVLYLIAVIQCVLMIASAVYEASESKQAIAMMFAVYMFGVWVPIFGTLSQQTPPTFVYIIVVVMCILFTSFGIVYTLKETELISTVGAEILYPVLSLTSKFQLQWLCYIGIGRSGDVGLGLVLGFGTIFGCALGVFAYKSIHFKSELLLNT